MITLFVISVLLLLLIGFSVLYIYLVRRRYSQFYCPKYTNVFLAHAYELVKAKRPFIETFLCWSKESGHDVFVLFSSWRVHIHVIDTRKIKDVLCSVTLLKPKEHDLSKFCGVDLLGVKSLFTEPGTPAWATKRKELDPHFHTAGLQKGYSRLIEVASDLVESIDCDEGTNIAHLMQQHVSYVIALFIMNIEDKEEFHSYTNKIASIFMGLSVKFRHKNTFWMPWNFKTEKAKVLKDLNDVQSYFKDFILSQNFEELDLNSCVGSLIKTNMEGDNLRIDLLVNELIMFFFAGIDTSMHTINFAFYEMLRDKAALIKIEDEIQQVFGGKEFIEYKEVNELKYLDKFIKEVLRYHPIVSSVTRETGPKGFNLCDQFIPRSTKVHVNIECVQKSEKFWKDPLKFSVDRWDESPVPFSYIPFSGGTRSCIGKKLALLEIKVFISSILRKYTIDFDRTDLGEISTKQVITNRLAKDLIIHFKIRESY